MLIRAIAEMEDGVDKAPVIPAKARAPSRGPRVAVFAHAA